MKTIKDLTSEVTENPIFQENVKKKFNEKSTLLQSLIKINYNYENERNTRFYDTLEFKGKTIIGYRPQDISTYDGRIENKDILDFNELENGRSEFIPGFQFIDKEKLNDFIKLIIDGKIEIKTVNLLSRL